jgi:hypothetical protein
MSELREAVGAREASGARGGSGSEWVPEVRSVHVRVCVCGGGHDFG